MSRITKTTSRIQIPLWRLNQSVPRGRIRLNKLLGSMLTHELPQPRSLMAWSSSSLQQAGAGNARTTSE